MREQVWQQQSSCRVWQAAEISLRNSGSHLWTWKLTWIPTRPLWWLCVTGVAV